jgi:hypothetical protein
MTYSFNQKAITRDETYSDFRALMLLSASAATADSDD